MRNVFLLLLASISLFSSADSNNLEHPKPNPAQKLLQAAIDKNSQTVRFLLNQNTIPDKQTLRFLILCLQSSKNNNDRAEWSLLHAYACGIKADADFAKKPTWLQNCIMFWQALTE